METVKRSRFRFSIRAQLIVIAALLVALPIAGYRLIQHFEDQTRGAIETALRASATLAAMAVRQWPNRSDELRGRVFPLLLRATPNADGYVDAGAYSSQLAANAVKGQGAYIANWQAKNEDADIENAALFVNEIRVDSGNMLKRLRPAPQGRAHRIRKRSNHVTLVLGSNTIES